MEPNNDYEFKQDRGDHAQRDELISLQQSLLWVVKVIGGAALIAIVSGVFVAVADHYKLSAVEQAVNSLTITTEKSAEDARSRNEIMVGWRATVDNGMVDQKAATLSLSNRVTNIENEMRQDGKRRAPELDGRQP